MVVVAISSDGPVGHGGDHPRLSLFTAYDSFHHLSELSKSTSSNIAKTISR